jgi:hypothetical protein
MSKTSKANGLVDAPAAKLLEKAVAHVKEVICKDFFAGRKPQPDRRFCNYFSRQQEDVLRNFSFADDTEQNTGKNMTYRRVAGIEMAKVQIDVALMHQDRRDLDPQFFIRSETMLSFQRNGDLIDAPAAILRIMPDATYDMGDARHRFVWGAALGCTKLNSLVVRCDDKALWDKVRRAFNQMNGAQTTPEERLRWVLHLFLEGGNGSIRDLCRLNGVQESKFLEFRNAEVAKDEAKQKGLTIRPTTPAKVVQTAALAVEKHGKEVGQKIIDMFDPAAAVVSAETSTPKVTPVADALLEELKENDFSPESIAEVSAAAREEQGKRKVSGVRGRGRNTCTHLAEGLKKAVKAKRRGSPKQIGLLLPVMKGCLKDAQEIVSYLKSGIAEAAVAEAGGEEEEVYAEPVVANA